MHQIYEKLVTGVRDYIKINNFTGILIGLSGGIDSALSMAIAADALGSNNVHSLMMPSQYTSEASISDARECAMKSQIKHDIIPIENFYWPILDSVKTLLTENLSSITQENVQSRIRAVILMTISNQTHKMVLATGNKSELYTGYCTLYGDTCGGYAVLKDVYKTEVYKLSEWRNTYIPSNSLNKQLMVIPTQIITKPPSAELKHNQKDTDNLPDYEILDPILMMLDKNTPIQDMIKQGYKADLINKIVRLFEKSKYKRDQSPCGPQIHN